MRIPLFLNPSRIWDCETGNCVQSLLSTSQKTPMYLCTVCLIPSLSSCFSPNNAYVLLSLADAHMYLWCLKDNTVEKAFIVAALHGLKCRAAIM